MEFIDFSMLFSRTEGNYNLPFLVEIYKPKGDTWYFTNDNRDITYNSKLYKAVPMSYKQPTMQDGIPSNGTLEIIIDEQKPDAQGIEQELLRFFDEADDTIGARVTAIISNDGSIRETGIIEHRNGTLSWDGRKITWNIGWDDRLNMQINPWQFTSNSLLA